MNESYRLGEQSIIAYLQRLANGISTAELDVAALPAELRAVGEQLQKTHAILQQERRLLESNAYIDPLTNLGNRNGFDRHVEQLWHKGDPFTCAYIDIDHLKHCNDRFGHAEGNRYILSICRTLSETMEHDEMLFRIGGDEFVLISLSANETELEQRLEQVRAGLIEASSGGKAPMIGSFSFGCSRVDPLAGDTRRQMTMDADRKMYRYKLMHRVQQPKDNDAPPHPIAEQLPCNDRVFQAISMSSETRYPFILNLDTGESQWHDEMLFRIGGDEFVLISLSANETELEQRLEQVRAGLIEASSGGKAPMIASFSFGCSRVNPLAGDTRRQMTMDADRKMYRYKLMHRVQQPKDDDAPQRPIVNQLPCNDRVFQAISMSSETRYPFILNLDTGESQWSVNAVRDFDLPSQHPFNSLDMWLARVHPEDRDNVRAELDMVINSTWHFHYMQYRVMDATGNYVLCDCTGYRLDGTDTEPSMYVGIIVNRSLADTTDSVTGLGDIHALVNAIGEMRRVPREAGFIAIKVDDIAEVNARFGFDAGDRVLAESAACLMDCSRGKGRLFRSTGPMFVALFDELGPEAIDEIASDIERFLGTPVLIGSLEYQPPIRVATLHLDGVDRQPVSILNELKALLGKAVQVPGTKLD